MKRWPVKPLREIAECLDGRRVPITAEVRTKGDVPYYGANGQVGWIDKPIFNEPLLLIAEDGGHFDQPEKGVAYMISGPSWVNNHAHVIRSDASKVRLEFLGHYFRHFNFMPFVTGTTRAKLNQKVLMSVPIPVPPLAEQERIVKLLDEADELRKLRAQADRRSAALIPALFHEMFGDPIENHRRLSVKELGSICKVLGGGTPSKKQPAYWVGDIPWVSPKDMSTDEIHDSEDHISERAINESTTNLIPVGSILVVTRSGILKHTLPVATNSVPVTINQDIKAFVPSDECEVTFLVAQLRFLSAMILKWVRVGATVQNIETEALRRLPVLIPPLPLQQEFAQRVSEIRALQAAQAASRQRTEHLFQSMLHRAFNQTLVREGA